MNTILAWLASLVLSYGLYFSGFLMGLLSWRELAGKRLPIWLDVLIWLFILPFFWLVYVRVKIALGGVYGQ